MPPARFPIEIDAGARQPLGMPVARFLCDYWQKRPLLIRNAFPDFTPPLSPDDLAGLACIEEADARIVTHDPGRDRWRVRSGPFDDTTFAQLPQSHWTLLVQDVDKWDVDTAALLAPFGFIPSWRIDDVMVSYAADAGGVGAHIDQYDVFLLQGLGQRRWDIDVHPDPPAGFRADVELKLLREFSSTHQWVLAPGDMLYLPPGVPHLGVGVGECMTFSIGMRAPASAELLLDFAHQLATGMPESRRYADPDLTRPTLPGEIDDDALARVRHVLGALAKDIDHDQLCDWFGCFITRYRSAAAPMPRKRPINAAAIGDRLPRSTVTRDAWSRFAWTRRGRNAVLYAAGEAFAAPVTWARTLAGSERSIAGATLLGLPRRDAGVCLLKTLIDAGHLHLRAG